jgi:methylated-DNA-[protein]-cysteine S-methyltransferase
MGNKTFQEGVLKLCCRIPRGRVTTYKIIAKKNNVPGGARAVGRALHANPKLIKVPCHRVVKSDGSVGGYRCGTVQKMKLLESEGVKVSKGRIEDFNKLIFKF